MKWTPAAGFGLDRIAQFGVELAFNSAGNRAPESWLSPLKSES